MGCDGDLAAQDDWLGAFLGAAPSLTLNGDVLTMTAKGSTITLTNQAAASSGLAPGRHDVDPRDDGGGRGGVERARGCRGTHALARG